MSEPRAVYTISTDGKVKLAFGVLSIKERFWLIWRVLMGYTVFLSGDIVLSYTSTPLGDHEYKRD